jgi:hypothetical protein
MINEKVKQRVMEKRQIKFRDKWYSIGDTIEIEETEYIGYFFKKKKLVRYNVTFIGNDCAATLSSEDGKWQKTITGSVEIKNEDG